MFFYIGIYGIVMSSEAEHPLKDTPSVQLIGHDRIVPVEQDNTFIIICPYGMYTLRVQSEGKESRCEKSEKKWESENYTKTE